MAKSRNTARKHAVWSVGEAARIEANYSFEMTYAEENRHHNQQAIAKAMLYVGDMLYDLLQEVKDARDS